MPPHLGSWRTYQGLESQGKRLSPATDLGKDSFTSQSLGFFTGLKNRPSRRARISELA